MKDFTKFALCLLSAMYISYLLGWVFENNTHEFFDCRFVQSVYILYWWECSAIHFITTMFLGISAFFLILYFLLKEKETI
jgi:hypothetical protein